MIKCIPWHTKPKPFFLEEKKKDSGKSAVVSFILKRTEKTERSCSEVLPGLQLHGAHTGFEFETILFIFFLLMLFIESYVYKLLPACVQGVQKKVSGHLDL